MSALVLSSGGMDSFLAWALIPSASNVFVNIGHKYHQKEMEALGDLEAALPGFQVTAVSGAPMGQFELPSGIIPMRNAELILCASHHGTEIALGVLADEINSDKSVAFFKAMETMLNESWRPQYWNENQGRTFTVYSPLRHVTKSEAVANYLLSGGDPDVLLKTVSCYSAQHRHCGQCASCFKRWVALKNNALECEFANPPIEWSEAKEVVHKARSAIYAPRRAAEILEAVGSCR